MNYLLALCLIKQNSAHCYLRYQSDSEMLKARFEEEGLAGGHPKMSRMHIWIAKERRPGQSSPRDGKDTLTEESPLWAPANQEGG